MVRVGRLPPLTIVMIQRWVVVKAWKRPRRIVCPISPQLHLDGFLWDIRKVLVSGYVIPLLRKWVLVTGTWLRN